MSLSYVYSCLKKTPSVPPSFVSQNRGISHHFYGIAMQLSTTLLTLYFYLLKKSSVFADFLTTKAELLQVIFTKIFKIFLCKIQRLLNTFTAGSCFSDKKIPRKAPLGSLWGTDILCLTCRLKIYGNNMLYYIECVDKYKLNRYNKNEQGTIRKTVSPCVNK